MNTRSTARTLYGECEERITQPLITETTIRVPGFGGEEDIVIWNEKGLDEFLRKPSRSECTYDKEEGVWIGPLEPVDIVEGLAHESGMLGYSTTEVGWVLAQQKNLDLVHGTYDGAKEYINDPEIEEALDVWREQDNMDDISDPSYFKEWIGEGAWVTDSNGKPRTFTPEMLEQREQLNRNFNFLWNKAVGEGGQPWCNIERRSGCEEMYIPEQYGEVELVSVGENHGVGKCIMGSVFVPRGVLKFLGSKAQVGQMFSASLEFVEEARYPWRVVKNSVQYIN